MVGPVAVGMYQVGASAGGFRPRVSLGYTTTGYVVLYSWQAGEGA